MSSLARRLLGPAAGLLGFLGSPFLLAEAEPKPPPPTGPAAEGRFPPLKLPPGFRSTLFACDPFIEYPSAVAAGPRAGSVFVAVDYLTGLGTEIQRRDEVRLLSDQDQDGYADRSTVYAGGFNSIQGLAFHAGTLYAMHAPFLTALRDGDGDGKADERRDLLSGLGLSPEENPVRLHAANGVAVGHDGWLYLALGDHGCQVERPEGDRLKLLGGGILRARPDGSDLHLFARGLRNIYDVALDEDLEVFVRDNENDGGEYKIRVAHSFFGADHGYPYLFLERPREALEPLADLGLGSSAGGLFYLETAFPAEYRGSLFFCEWGRAVVRYRPERAGSGFAPLREIEFASGAENDPYGFKPTDLAVLSDGSLVVADWADGQRPRRGRGRIYRIVWGGVGAQPAPEAGEVKEATARPLGEWLARLDSESRRERIEAQEALERRGAEGRAAVRESLHRRSLGARGRLHGVWVLARAGGEEALGDLLDLAGTDPDPRVQAQAVRAAADLCDPALARHRLEAGPGDATAAARLAALGRGRGREPRVLREVLVALGRLRFGGAPHWLAENLGATPAAPDPALEHAAQGALRRSESWPALLGLLDRPEGGPLRALALRAVADRAEPQLTDGLIDRLGREPEPARRREYADLLVRVARKPGPEPYWGYRPPPRPPNRVAWERTGAIDAALDRALADPDRAVRFEVLRRMRREKIAAGLESLSRWLGDEVDPERAALILESLRDHPASGKRQLLESVIGGAGRSPATRLLALSMFADELDGASEGRLLQLAGSLEDGPVLAEALRRAGKRPGLEASPLAGPLIAAKLGSQDPEVRAAALEAAGELRLSGVGGAVRELLEDREARVRAAAAAAAGRLGLRAAAGALLGLARDVEPAVRRASFESLRLLGEPGAVPLALGALADPEAGPSALACLGEVGGPEAAGAVVELARRSPSADLLPLAARILIRWMEREESRRLELERAAAELQGSSGVLLIWRAAGPLPASAAAGWIERFARAPAATPEPAPLPDGGSPPWRTLIGAGIESPIRLDPAQPPEANGVWLARSDLSVSEETPVQLLAASSGSLAVWLNGLAVYRRDEARAFRADSDRFEARLEQGTNRLLVQVSSPRGPAELQARFRRKSSTAERESLTQAALNRPGDAERGRKLFFDAGKSPCSKCHRLGGQGERFGPDLTGIGRRFSRIHLIESILEPGLAIAPGFETAVVVLRDGRVLAGIKVAETAETLVLGDSDGRRNPIARPAIRDHRLEPLSIMPEGLEKQLTAEEFIDLIAFLASQR